MWWGCGHRFRSALICPGPSAQVTFFMGGATAHGAWANHTDKPRRAALFNYVSTEVHYCMRKVAVL